MKKIKNKKSKINFDFIKNFFNKENLINLFKKITIKQIFILAIIITVFVISYKIFFTFNLFITVDGSFYYSYLKYYNGLESIGTWPTVRGFGFPTIIFLITKIFGDSIHGFVSGFFVFYLLLLIFAALILNKMLKDNNVVNRFKYWVIYFIFFIINPLIIGYSHNFLTEAIVPSIYMITAFICLKWKDILFKENKLKFIFVAFLLIFLSVYVWFIKQPYAPTMWIFIFFSAVLSGIMNKNLKDFISKMIVFIIMISTTILSINIWANILLKNGKQELENTNSGILSGMLLSSNTNFKKVKYIDYCDFYYFDNKNMSETDKIIVDEIKSKENYDWCNNIIVYNVFDLDDNVIETKVLKKNDGSIDTFTSIKYYLSNFIEHPILFMHAYLENYLAILNFEKVIIDPEIGYIASGEITGIVAHENSGIGYGVLNPNYNSTWWQWEKITDPYMISLYEGMEHFEGSAVNNKNSNIPAFLQGLTQLSNITFSYGLLISLPVFIYGFIMCLKNKKSNAYFLITILSAGAFADVAFNTLLGALIDRYCYPVYPLMLLCLIIMFIDKKKEKN